MSETYTGKNVDAAVAKAAKKLGVDAGTFKYEVLAGQTGGFALIKVVGGAVAAAPKGSLVETLTGDGPTEGGDDAPRSDRRDRDDRGRDDRRGRGRDDRGGRGRDDRGGRGRDDRGGRGRDDRGRGRDDRGGRGRDDRGGRGRGRDDRRGGGGGGGGGRGRGRRPEPLPAIAEDAPTEVTLTVAGDAELGRAAAAARDMIVGLMEAMGFGVTIELEETDDLVRINLVGEHFHDVLWANEMEVLDAVEHLVDKITNVDQDERKKVLVDSNGQRAKADLDLGQSARDMADRAMTEGRVIKIGPLDPRSRRIIHMTLKEIEGVATKSEGEGVFRRVCIIPRKPKQDAPEQDAAPVDSDGDNSES